MITRDPYGISGAVAPWRSLDAMEPIVERMALDGYGPETIAQATGYSISTTTEYMKQFFRAGPCERCASKSICDAVGGTCNRKERWKAIKEVPNGGR